MSIGGVDMVVTPISASQQSIGFSVKHRSLHSVRGDSGGLELEL